MDKDQPEAAPNSTSSTSSSPSSGVDYTPLMEALPAYEGFIKDILMKRRGSLTKTQMDVLVGLGFAGKMGMSQVAKRLAVSKEQATRAVAPLVEKGFVVRSRNSEQYRVVEIDLTDAGRAFLKSSRAGIDHDVNERLSQLSQGDRDRLMEASKTAAEILRKLNPRQESSQITPPVNSLIDQ